MTNFGAGYILAALHRRANARQVRVLIALETFGCDRDGWRSVSQVTLAAYANVDLKTLKRARAELLDKKLIEYKPGLWKGVQSRYRICVPPLDKGSPSEPFSASQRGSTCDPLTRGRKGGQHRLQRGSTKPPKGVNGLSDNSTNVAGQATENGVRPESPALSAEAEALLKLSASARGTFAATPNGAAPDPRHDIPPWSLSNLCREEQHDACIWNPCQCRCHRGPQALAAIAARRQAVADAKAELDRIRKTSTEGTRP